VRTIWGVVGGLIVLGTFMSEVRTLVVPRVFRPGMSNMLGRVVYVSFQFLANRFERYETKDRILAYAGPLSVVAKLVGWLGSFLTGYSMVNFSLGALDLRASIREAGSSLFTLGFASADKSRLNAVDFCAAVTGPVSIGLLVGYLPALYAAYARRETEVTMLEARAGGPAWGPEILARYAMVNLNDQLPDLYRGWERWTADVSEPYELSGSHLFPFPACAAQLAHRPVGRPGRRRASCVVQSVAERRRDPYGVAERICDSAGDRAHGTRSL